MLLSNPWIAALSALFVWWFSTGAILYAVKRADTGGPGGHVATVILGLPLLFLGIYGVLDSVDDTSPRGAYVSFLSALAVWGWIELAFLCGVVTGPNTRPLPPGVEGWERFLRAWGTIAWHEMLLVAGLFLLVFLTRGMENSTALWTFAVMFFARVSAKLNLFFGVPHIHTEFLPSPLSHLASHFRRRAMNWVFPISVSLLTFATFCWLERAFTTGRTEFSLLAALTALALLEHWLMVLPLPDEKLWRWMLPAPKLMPKTNDKTLLREEPHGF
ncbi:putative photosynthetic complex assembly protein PuhE [Oceaniglobus roseus]|uniref:putative photosynthetic complex assembly protein PuhE n=1 Tax=Oceaniglobus roseus TaxID=1737570 RepID=UPI000C7EBD84|nr:putative photosynthetic complex assembly protein PuhE [Kandeliimicrobium roseum]